MKKIFSLIVFLQIIFFAFAQQVQHVSPPNWWVGMHNPNLQLLIHGENITGSVITINYPGVELVSTEYVQNPNYIIINLLIDSTTKPGTMQFEFKASKKSFSFSYELKKPEPRNYNYGLDGGDFIYLLMPDRFANGDTTNDSFKTMQETDVDRNSMLKRHGGDLQGIINHLDYIQSLGVTAIWTTPMIENDQPLYSYHGYATTDNYNIDPRIGTNELYKEYVNACHKRNIKVVMDIVHNHVGDQHWFIRDMPMEDWVNVWPEFTRTNYRTSSLHDMYASESDKKLMSDGWFDTHMPDLNQRNTFVANYLIQNNIWWIEYAQVDAFRLDTYPYSDLEFLIDWKKAIDLEYPGFGVFAEVWVDGVGVQGYFAGDNNLNTGYNSLLPGVTDFTLYEAMHKGLNENFGWYEGLRRIYHTLSQDYIYSNSAFNNVLFLSNHDVSRIYSVLEKNLDKTKMAAIFFMTTRGIPQWYYGDELLMEAFGNPMDALRPDFPGGWQSDTINKFETKNISGAEKEYFEFIKTLANWRKDNPVFEYGKLMQYIPEDGIYVYFRYTDDASVMVILNSNEEEKIVATKRFYERLHTYTKGKNVISGETLSDLKTITIPKQSGLVIELKH